MPEKRSSPSTKVRDIFLDALDYSTSRARGVFLAKACAGNPSLRAAVEDLLRHHKKDDFLEKPAIQRLGARTSGEGPATPVPAAMEQPGDRIGNYQLLEVIGEGGGGIVYLADQVAPIRRQVALKIIKPGMDTKSVMARFETERQALAMMNHPNIARVFDAGATETGRPFFVMELVQGIRITEYCDQQRLSTQARLDLFIQVCQAIQHAHQKGIIHRDIKPSNILVTSPEGTPMPKVIDFGIAKAMEKPLTEITFCTEFQTMMGTPAYMSPEQADMSGLDIDTRTDIYSLGVLLYELLTGKTPFDSKGLLASGLDGLRRTLREEEPLRPSTRLRSLPEADVATTAQRRQVEPAKLAGIVVGDLDWIVMKALEKDPARRYGTAHDLALDIQRYLDNEPVAARPPSNIYRFYKLVRRNKLAFAATSAFVATLLLGLVFSTWQYLEINSVYQRVIEAQREQRRLREDAQKSQAAETQLRHQAEIQALDARRKAYAADMNLTHHALEMDNLGRAKELLERQRPQSGQTDLRGWEWRYLWQNCQSDALFTLCQQTNEICSLSASADGRWLAIGEAAGGLSIWDMPLRQAIERLPTGGGRAIVAFSPAEPWLAFGSSEGFGFRNRQQRVKIWDAAARRYVADLPIGGVCRGLAFSQDGRTLMTATSDKLTLWAIPESKPVASHALSEMGFFGGLAQVSRDLRLAAYTVSGGKIRVIDLASGKELWTVPAAEENVMALAFSPDGKMLASGAGYVESAIRLWEVATGRELGRLEGHRTWVSSLVFWPDGKTLASASADQTIRLWDMVNMRPLGALRGHKLEVWSLALMAGKRTLVSGSKDGSVCVWDTRVIRHDRSHIKVPGAVRSWRFAPDSQSIFAVNQQGRVVNCRGADFQEIQPLFDFNVLNALFSPDGQYLAVGRPNSIIQVWDLQRRVLQREITAGARWAFPVSFLPSSNHLVIHHGNDNSFHEWDVATGMEIRSWRPAAGTGRRLPGALFAASKDWFLMLNSEGAGWLRNLAAGSEISLGLKLRQVAQVTMAPDGKLFAVVDRLGTANLWDVPAVQNVATLHGFVQAMHGVTFSPDGQRLAISGDGKEAVKFWDMGSLQELLTLEGQGSQFNVLAFSPDGNLLGSSNSRGILHLWRAPDMESIDKPQSPHQ